jgi:hypothetical protein
VVAEANVAAGGVWRGIDDLSRLVGAYCWVEHRIFELTGAWASAPADDAGTGTASERALQAERRVWCAAVSRHHGALAGCWAERLPVRAGIDRCALVAPPDGHLADALDALEAEPDLCTGVGTLVQGFLPRLNGAYLAHLRTAAAVSEAPVMEVLVGGQRLLAGEIRDGRRLCEGVSAPSGRGVRLGELVERAFERSSVFPAVRPS